MLVEDRFSNVPLHAGVHALGQLLYILPLEYHGSSVIEAELNLCLALSQDLALEFVSDLGCKPVAPDINRVTSMNEAHKIFILVNGESLAQELERIHQAAAQKAVIL